MPISPFSASSLPPPTKIYESDGYTAAYWNPLPEAVDKFITSDLDHEVVRSWKPNCPIPKHELAYIQLDHYDFQGGIQKGELMVNRDVADEAIAALGDFFKAKYPIEQMRLIDHYNADDDASMLANNSSAFCSREITKRPGVFSKHSYGRAIDINPKYNPYVFFAENYVAPTGSDEYLDRTRTDVPYMFKSGDVCVTAFTSRGWDWGGGWTQGRVDYHHFEKEAPVSNSKNV